MLKNALIFAIAALTLAFAAPSYFGVTTRPAIANAPADAAPAAAVPSGADQSVAAAPSDEFRETTIPADGGGQYRAKVLIEGQDVDVMIDTGATVVALTAETAARLGVATQTNEPRWRMSTANGVVFATPVMLKSVSLGEIYMSDVQAVVMPPGASNANLLGASFLKRLASLEQRDGALVLRQ